MHGGTLPRAQQARQLALRGLAQAPAGAARRSGASARGPGDGGGRPGQGERCRAGVGGEGERNKRQSRPGPAAAQSRRRGVRGKRGEAVHPPPTPPAAPRPAGWREARCFTATAPAACIAARHGRSRRTPNFGVCTRRGQKNMPAMRGAMRGHPPPHAGGELRPVSPPLYALQGALTRGEEGWRVVGAWVGGKEGGR